MLAEVSWLLAAMLGAGEVETILADVDRSGDFDAAVPLLGDELDRVATTADLADTDRFREAAFALRLVRQLSAAEDSSRRDLYAWLRARSDLAQTLAFLVREDAEKPAEVYALLDRLRLQRGARVEKYPELAAAICVVHDRKLTRRINENSATAADPVALFDYFVANERRMAFGVRHVPAELLVWVVDSTAGLDEMTWALKRYAGHPQVGALFFDIDYDFDHFRDGKPKKVTRAGWNLPNILRYGGVCADQAYFAMSVGKSIGVPTAYATGRGGTVIHAWVGFLEARGGEAHWNFDAGRYPEYRGVLGAVTDPQTQQRIPDSTVSLLAELARVKQDDRHAAAAYVDAAARLVALKQEGSDVEPILALLETGLRMSPGQAAGWLVVRQLADDGALSLEQKKRWAGVLHRLCAERYPDFYFDVVSPMIESIPDATAQDELWARAFEVFQGRHDLAAAVLAARAHLWEQAGEPARAGRCYEEIISRYANAGPFVVPALKQAEQILRAGGGEGKILQLYREAFSLIQKPQDMAGPFFQQSNWYRVGSLLADHLDAAGLPRDAAMVRQRLRG